MSDAKAFIEKWQGVPASELATSQSFLLDLCTLLGVATPHATDDQAYMFERPITFSHGDGSTSAGRIDLYRRGCFVLESKKLKAASAGKVDESLLRARSQAERYARALPAGEGRPPFLIVVDVGHRIELYSEFSRSGATYTPYPDPRNHRIALQDLADDAVRERLRAIWQDPLSLDPAKQSARVTREIAGQLAQLALSLEADGHNAQASAAFLQRCLFTMFAEDVGLLPAKAFQTLMETHQAQPETAMRMLQALWRDMDGGGFSAVLAKDVLHFNGKLFKQPDTVALSSEQIGLLIGAAKADWRHVEPAIFGTLLERALNPAERHKLGAHYTPRAYVERLVLPTVIEPLRQEWDEAQAAALTLDREGKHDKAGAELRRFHTRLCQLRVLDPACGSGNFLYVTLEHLKRLEGEVLNALHELGDTQTGLAIDGERFDATAAETVDPHNLLGIEVNARAAAIAELVLWIGYLQWHFRTHGDVRPPQPVIRDFANIEHRDAVLAWDDIEYETDAAGKPISRWDGVTHKKHPVTGEDVPDEAAQTPIERYVNPRKATWPQADFIVGNPPFIGASTMRRLLGDGYTEALRKTWPEVPESADFVMYWWHAAAETVRAGKAARFGLITTNSLRQTFNRRVVQAQLAAKKQPLALQFVIPDHPWVDAGDGAAVRIAMSVAACTAGAGRLLTVTHERKQDEDGWQVELAEQGGVIHPDLRVGANVAAAIPLLANDGLSCPGLKLHGSGFIVTPERAAELGLGHDPAIAQVIRPYRNGKDLTASPRGVMVIDLFGLEVEQVRAKYPAIYQHVLEHVKPERDQNKRATYRDNWWLHGETRSAFRPALTGLDRYIVTVETMKHRLFTCLDAEVAPDNMLVVVASDRAELLGCLSSVVHIAWALRAGGTLEDRPRYNKSVCFEPFPFPALNTPAAQQAGQIAEQLDAHRKRQQAAHPKLTLTAMYNVLDKLRTGDELTDNERETHEQGLVSVLRQLHDELDAAVLDAYGWANLLPDLRVAHGLDAPRAGSTQAGAKRAFDDAVLERLVALNAERTAEEARGHIRWLRPEFQNPNAAQTPEQTKLAADGGTTTATAAAAEPAKRSTWPKDPLEQVRAVAGLLRDSPIPLDQDNITAQFKGRGKWKQRVPDLLDTLVAVGQATEADGQYAAA